MKLYNSNFSPNCLRVRAVAFELGCDLEIDELNFIGNGPDRPKLDALNPAGKVPVLQDGDFVLWESRAINRYLAASCDDGLYPRDPKVRATIDQWSFWQAVHLGPSMQSLVFEVLFKAKFGMGEPDPVLVERKRAETNKYLAVLETALGDKTWIAGDLSLADFALASTFMFRERAGISLDEYPHAAAWIERLEGRPSWRRAVEPLYASNPR